jgi:soluble lytic murein transglycosylase-like protein
MSLVTAAARVAELSSLLGTGATASAATAAASTPGDFEARLAGAEAGSVASATLAAASATGESGSSPYAAEIEAAAARHGLDPALLRGLIRAESGFDPTAGSPAGARGLAQLMPGTAAALGVTNPLDPAQSIEGGATYLRQQLDRFGGDVAKALAAYNAGPGAVARHGGVPPYAETQAYVRRVMQYAEEYRGASVPAAGASLPYSTV